MASLLEIRNLNAGYGRSDTLFDVSLEVRRGEIFGVVGPNGSGKSTLLKSIFGLTTIHKGSIIFDGNRISGLSPHRIARLGMTYSPQIDGVYSRLTVRENLRMAAYIMKDEQVPDAMNRALDFFPFLEREIETKAASLSGGERQMLVLASALMRSPTLIMLDEPGANLSPALADRVFDKVNELNHQKNVTIIVVEQDVKRIFEICGEACLLVTGRVRFNGKSDALANDPNLFKVFLGVD